MMKFKSIMTLCFVASMALLVNVQAQDKNSILKMTVVQDTVLFGHSIHVKFTIKNGQGDFEAPTFEDFTIISGPNTMSSMTMVNGVVDQTMEYSYILRPNTEGEFYIAEAHLTNGKETYQTFPKKVVVLPNPEGAPQESIETEPNIQYFDFGFPDDDMLKPAQRKKRKRTKI